MASDSLNHCPKCGGPADNGHDRCHSPTVYWCTKCMKLPEPPINKLRHIYKLAIQQAYLDNNTPQKSYWKGALRALDDVVYNASKTTWTCPDCCVNPCQYKIMGDGDSIVNSKEAGEIPVSPAKLPIDALAKQMFTNKCVNDEYRSAPWEQQPEMVKQNWRGKAIAAMGEESIRKDEAQLKTDALADGLCPSPASHIAEPSKMVLPSEIRDNGETNYKCGYYDGVKAERERLSKPLSVSLTKCIEAVQAFFDSGDNCAGHAAEVALDAAKAQGLEFNYVD